MKSPSPAGADAPLGGLLERPEPLSPDDVATVAAARLRELRLPALPVAQDGRLVGLLSERALLVALAGQPGFGPHTRCSELVGRITTVPLTTPLEDVLWTLRRDDIELLTVVDLEGRYAGVLSRNRLAEGLENAIRPRAVGGMATPLGVHLTSIDHRGGAGDLALALSGVVVGLLYLASHLAVALAVGLASHDPMRAAMSELSGGLAGLRAVPAPASLNAVLLVLAFLVMLRMSPLTGYHSGEHQAVHAVERGLPLTLDNVSAMPRAHLRCGTNLIVLLYLLTALGFVLEGGTLGLLLLVPLVPALVHWRRIGMLVQQVFTTKPAAEHQLRSGIAAAEALLERYRAQPSRRAAWYVRIWNRGLLQVAAGMFATVWLAGKLLAGCGWLLARW